MRRTLFSSVKSAAGLKMTLDEYVALRRSFDNIQRYTGNREAAAT